MPQNRVLRRSRFEFYGISFLGGKIDRSRARSRASEGARLPAEDRIYVHVGGARKHRRDGPPTLYTQKIDVENSVGETTTSSFSLPKAFLRPPDERLRTPRALLSGKIEEKEKRLGGEEGREREKERKRQRKREKTE